MEVSGSKLLKVDAKARVLLPKFVLESDADEAGKKTLLTSLWLTTGLDGCLWLLDHPEWRRLQRRLKSSDIGGPRLRAVHRFFYERATRVRPDAQSRILLPPALRDFAKIEAEALLLGVGRRVEIWSPAVFDGYRDTAGTEWIKDLEAILSGEEGPV